MHQLGQNPLHSKLKKLHRKKVLLQHLQNHPKKPQLRTTHQSKNNHYQVPVQMVQKEATKVQNYSKK